MNKYDRENLQFLLNASPDLLQDWFNNVEEDDIEYASEIMSAYSEELKIKTVLLQDPIINSLIESKEYLSKFR